MMINRLISAFSDRLAGGNPVSLSRQHLVWIPACAGMTRTSVVMYSYLILLAILISGLSGCGVYSFKGQGIGGIKTIAVDPFDNRTTEFGIREKLTDAILTRLLNDRTLTVASPRSADAILTGVVLSIEDKPLTYQASETVTEYQVVISIEAKLIRQGVSEPVWQGRIVGEGNYPFSTGSAAERQNGVDIALEKIVRDLLNRLTSDW